MVYCALGENHKALDYLGQALEIHRAMADRSGEALSLNNLGGTYWALGERLEALENYRQALLIENEVGLRPFEATTFGNIGMVCFELGKLQKALDYLGLALTLQRAVDDPDGQATDLPTSATSTMPSVRRKKLSTISIKPSPYFAWWAIPWARQ